MLILARYIGNKGDLLGPILEEVGKRASPGDLVCDIFSGTLAVSLELKRQGYRVASNDINLLSAVFGRAYLTSSSVPVVDLATLLPRSRVAEVRATATEVVEQLEGRPGFQFLAVPVRRSEYELFVALLVHLETVHESDLPAAARRTYIFDIYSAEGRRSAFVSSRGSRGRRSFFAGHNARRIDLILNQLRVWHIAGLLGDQLLSALLAVLLTGVEKISNTQGTYHDFPRGDPDPRARHPLSLAPPPLDGLLGPSQGHILGIERDSLDFIREVPHHKVLYLDPPYNFRQYTAYYFLPNVLSRYVHIEDLESYFSGIRYVRGQNPADDFSSTFNSPRLFIDSLATLIGRADTEWVVLSYFSGRNHWGEFKSDNSAAVGQEKVTQLFESDLFRPGSQRVVPISRMNYQSYGGHRAKAVDEYLFVAEKVQ